MNDIINTLKLLHGNNHYTVNNYYCSSNNNKVNILSYEINKPIYNLKAGIYLFILNDNKYLINIYLDLYEGDYLLIENENDIRIVLPGNIFKIKPYLYINNIDAHNTFILNNTVNDFLDIIFLDGNTTMIGNPSIDNKCYINRITELNIISKATSKIYNNEQFKINIGLKHSLGSLPNGIKDSFVIDAYNKIAYNILRTTKEMLTANLNWQFKKDLSNDNCYIFFANNTNISKSDNSMRCNKFISIDCDALINKNNNYNCIAVSNNKYDNGIWIKINKKNIDFVSNDNNILKKFKLWIINNMNNGNNIYIEYELSKYVYSMVLLDSYFVKTWYKGTAISCNVPIDVCYKSL